MNFTVDASFVIECLLIIASGVATYAAMREAITKAVLTAQMAYDGQSAAHKRLDEHIASKH